MAQSVPMAVPGVQQQLQQQEYAPVNGENALLGAADQAVQQQMQLQQQQQPPDQTADGEWAQNGGQRQESALAAI